MSEQKIISRGEAKELQFKRYFTGIPCKRCGKIDYRYVLNSRCATCNKIAVSKFSKKIKEEGKNKRKEYNPELLSLRLSEAMIKSHKERREKKAKEARENNQTTLEIITRVEALERKLKFFFINKKCKNGHVCEWYTKANGCKKCAEMRSRRWSDEKRESRRQSMVVSDEVASRLRRECGAMFVAGRSHSGGK